MASHRNPVDRTVPASLPAWLSRQAQAQGSGIALRHKRLGIWQQKSWAQTAAEVGRLAAGLAARGIGSGSTLVLLTHPRPEALLLSLAAQSLGGTAAPLDPLLPQHELDTILAQLQPGVLFAEDQVQVDRVLRGSQPGCQIVYADARGLAGYRRQGLLSYEALSSSHAAPVQTVAPDSAAFAFYRIGAEGSLQSQRLDHRTLLAEGRLLVEAEQLTRREQALVARAFATAGHVRYLLAPWLIAGFTLNFPENLATRDNDRRELGPTLVLGTSETYARLADLVQTRLPVPGSWSRRLTDWALASGRRGLGRLAAYWLVRRPLRDVIGFSRTRVPLLAGGGLSAETRRLFDALGVAVRALPDRAEWQAHETASHTRSWWRDIGAGHAALGAVQGA